jgi:hypothetical protein
MPYNSEYKTTQYFSNEKIKKLFLTKLNVLWRIVQLLSCDSVNCGR